MRLEALLRLYPRLGTSSNLTIPAWPDAFHALTPLLVATALALPLSKGRGRRQTRPIVNRVLTPMVNLVMDLPHIEGTANPLPRSAARFPKFFVSPL